MRKSVISLILIFLSTSCSFLRNSSEVRITIDSEPLGARVYVDGEYYGDTILQLNLVPDRNYNLKLVKEGYQTIETVLKTKFTMRKRINNSDKKRCKMDFVFSPLIINYFSLKSSYCRDFEKGVYLFQMKKAAIQPFIFGYQAVPPQYVPPQSAQAAENIYTAATYYSAVPVPQYPQPAPVNQQPMSTYYSNPYQNYDAPYPPQGNLSGAPSDFDGSYTAPMYYDQNYQPVPNQPQEKPPHIY